MCNPDLDAEFDSLRPGASTQQGATRRTALKAAIGVGYAAATLPVTAQTVIRTSDEGLKAGPVKYTVDGFEVPAYMAAPAGKTGLPVVLVVQEIFGVHEYIADTARRFAQAGYLAIAPELYARQGGEQGARCAGDGRSRWRAAPRRGERRQRGQSRHHGLLLGRALRLALCGHRQGQGRRGLVRAPRGPEQRTHAQAPVDIAANLQAPVLGLYGGKDQGIPLDTVDKMKGVLAAGSPAAKASQFVVYSEAGHAFHADYRPSYVKSAADDGWQRTLAWFKANGVA